jgi:hypothetical protein
VPNNAVLVRRKNKSVPKYERPIKDDPDEISSIVGNQQIGKGNTNREVKDYLDLMVFHYQKDE